VKKCISLQVYRQWPIFTSPLLKGDVHLELEGDIIEGRAKNPNPNKVGET
jgi:hypothetical protein